MRLAVTFQPVVRALSSLTWVYGSYGTVRGSINLSMRQWSAGAVLVMSVPDRKSQIMWRIQQPVHDPSFYRRWGSVGRNGSDVHAKAAWVCEVWSRPIYCAESSELNFPFLHFGSCMISAVKLHADRHKKSSVVQVSCSRHEALYVQSEAMSSRAQPQRKAQHSTATILNHLLFTLRIAITPDTKP